MQYLRIKATSKSPSTDRVQKIFMVICLRVLMEIIYVIGVVPVYGYMGFFSEPTMQGYVTSWASFVLSLALFWKLLSTKALSSAILALLYCISFIPANTMAAYQPFSGYYLYYIYWVILLLAVIFLPKFSLSQNHVYFSKGIIILICMFMLASVLFVWAKYANFRLSINIFDVYGMRQEAQRYVYISFIKYCFSFSRTALPLVCVYLLYQRSYDWFFLISIFPFLSFSIDGMKSVIFLYFSSVFLFFILSRYPNLLYQAPLGIALINGLGLIEYLIGKSNIIINFISRRVMFVPSLLNYYYYDFFSLNDVDLFRSSLLRRIGLESPYPLGIPHTIGLVYFGNNQVGANNGLFSDAFSHLGQLGIFIMPLLVAFVLRIVEMCSEKMPNSVVVAVMLATAMNLNSSNLFTVLLTHGLLLNCILLFFFKRNEKSLMCQNKKNIKTSDTTYHLWSEACGKTVSSAEPVTASGTAKHS